MNNGWIVAAFLLGLVFGCFLGNGGTPNVVSMPTAGKEFSCIILPKDFEGR